MRRRNRFPQVRSGIGMTLRIQGRICEKYVTIIMATYRLSERSQSAERVKQRTTSTLSTVNLQVDIVPLGLNRQRQHCRRRLRAPDVVVIVKYDIDR